MIMKASNSKNLIALKKAKTSLEKIIQMIEKDQYCINIIQQNLAVIWLLKSVNASLLQGHLWCCMVDAVKSNNKKQLDGMIDEVMMIVKTAQNK